ncbi:MAG: IPT/TIG domain-containing protein [Planctomycetota bacterium]
MLRKQIINAGLSTAIVLLSTGKALPKGDAIETLWLATTDAAEEDRLGSSVSISGNIAVAGAPEDDAAGLDAGSAYVFDVSTGAQLFKLIGSDTVAGDRFGISVSISGNIAIVGAYLNDAAGSDSGSAYLFDVTTGQELFKLTASDPGPSELFGHAVAISGTTAIVGAYFDTGAGSQSGAVYVFDVTTGQELFKLNASDAGNSDHFGFSVALDGNTAVIGARGDDDGGVDSGSAYLFDVTTGQELFKLTASDAGASDRFGSSVGIDGNTAIIGAYFDSDLGQFAGSAYLFDVSTGAQLFKLTAFDAAQFDQFGTSVTVTGSIALVGSPEEDTPFSSSGSVYLFDVATGGFLTKWTASDAIQGARFGISASAEGNVATVGAFLDNPGGANSGSLYGVDLTTGLEVSKMRARDASAGDEMGISVALDGNTVLVGAHGDDESEVDAGSVYVYDAVTGQEQLKLMASDASVGDRLGVSVGLSGNNAIAGAHRDDDLGADSGSAYVFDVTTGQQLFKLTASDGAAGDDFGYAVAMSGTVAIVGAYRDDDFGADSGSAYLFDVTTGQELFKLNASDAAANDFFGFSVAISGNEAIVGAYGNDDGGSTAGSAYVFDVTTGQELFKLVASDPSSNDNFGRAVAIGGGRAVVGAYHDFITGFNAGSAYVFDTTNGQELFKLTASDTAPNDFFGTSVALDGSLAIIGANGDDDGGSSSGSAYVFDVTTGQEISKATASNAASGDELGSSVSIQGTRIVVGAYRSDIPDAASGSAYLFDIVLDTTPPGTVTNLQSTSHTASVWSMTTTIDMSWTAATDDNSGVDGYSVLFDQSPASDAPMAKVLEETTTTYSEALSSSANGYYFHIRAVDECGNWGDTVHAGPYLIDAVAPGFVTGLSSSSHPTGTWSNDPDLVLEWTPATDAESGIAGYGTSVSTAPELPAEVQDLGDVVTTTISPGDGASWHFNIRSLDIAGNWDDDSVSIGPFLIDTQSPSNGTIEIDGAAESTHSLVVSLDSLSATDALSGVAMMQFSGDGATWSAEETFAASRSGWDLSAFGGDDSVGTKTVYVRYLDAAGNTSASFTDTIDYTPVPEITTISPRRGPLAGGNTITISGTGFTPDTTVTFGGVAGGVTYVSASELQVVVPAGTFTPPASGSPRRLASDVEVVVTTPHGMHSVANGYTYVFKR